MFRSKNSYFERFTDYLISTTAALDVSAAVDDVNHSMYKRCNEVDNLTRAAELKTALKTVYMTITDTNCCIEIWQIMLR